MAAAYYTTGDLAKVARRGYADVLRILAKEGIHPLRSVKTASRTYHHWGMNAYEAIANWRSLKDVPAPQEVAEAISADSQQVQLLARRLDETIEKVYAAANNMREATLQFASLQGTLASVLHMQNAILDHLTTPKEG